jgi:hypothetical protein
MFDYNNEAEFACVWCMGCLQSINSLKKGKIAIEAGTKDELTSEPPVGPKNRDIPWSAIDNVPKASITSELAPDPPDESSIIGSSSFSSLDIRSA